MKFEKLFEPIAIGGVLINNRIVMAPMGIAGLVDNNGGVTQRGIDYYAERALGGVGLIVATVVKVNELEPRTGIPFMGPKSLSTFSELTETVHYYGSKIFVQLTAGLGRCIVGEVIDKGFKPVSASANQAYWRPNVTTRELTTGEIEGLIKDLANGAALAQQVEFDGVELHGHEGYLFDQFTTALWNNRKDEYGGSLENRLRFPIEVLNAIRKKVGQDFPIVYRYGLKHYIKAPWVAALGLGNYAEAGRDTAEGLEMAKLLEKAGFTALHVDAGSYDSWYWAHPPTYQAHGCIVDMAAEVKKVVNIPVIAVGRLDIPEIAEKVLQENKTDMVALGRGLLADPYWAKKVHQGKVDEIVPCVGCHDGCLKRMLVDFKHLSCAVNPATGKERLNILVPVQKPTRVLIAGGGVAGLEAARVATLRGCRVTLYEKSDKLGGHLMAASVPDFKEDYRRLLNWYYAQLKGLGVDIKLETEATPEIIREEKPDKLIISTGSIPIIPDVPGIDRPSVATCPDLLLGKKKGGATIVVIGGGLVGCETALWLAKQGKRVTIVEVLPEMASGVFHANRVMLLDMLKEYEVGLVNNAKLEKVLDNGVNILDRTSESKTIRCDTVALALGLKRHEKLYEPLRKEFTELYLIGDCKEPRKIMDAIWDAYYVASR